MTHAFWEAGSHNGVSVMGSVYTNYIQQIGRAHRPAEAFHHLIYLAEVCAIAYQAEKPPK